MSAQLPYPFALVVNTSVVRAAGTSTHSVSQRCREVLNLIEALGYKIAMCRELEEEWEQQVPERPAGEWSFYISRLAMEWYNRMKNYRRVLYISLPKESSLRDQVSNQAQTLWPGIRQVEKDLFLIELALETDRRVISLNDKQQKQFSQIARHVQEIASVLWLNPDQENVPEWLRNGAPDEPQYRLDP